MDHNYALTTGFEFATGGVAGAGNRARMAASIPAFPLATFRRVEIRASVSASEN
jgi:hypothetical protein